MSAWVKGLRRRHWTVLAILLLAAGAVGALGNVRVISDDLSYLRGRLEQASQSSPPVSPLLPPAGQPAEVGFSATTAEAQARPNVVLITVDTLRADALGVYGNPRARTPNMDSLAQDGALFSMAMTTEPQTNPTHASFLTGMFPARHGIAHHMASFLSDAVKPLAEILGESGYDTAAHYSWISFDSEYSGLQRGFATYERYTVDRPFPTDRKPDFYEEYLDSRADVTLDGVLAWLGSRSREPFFLWIHLNDAHWPYDPPSPFSTMFDSCQTCMDGSLRSIIRIAEGYKPTPEEVAHLRGLYDGEVAFIDQQLGRLFDRMEENGSLDQTLVVLSADHGEGFGEKGLWSHQEVMYNTAVRIPLVVRYPGTIPNGVVGAPVSPVDILPTVMEILGMPVPEGIQGRSLMPLMRGVEDGSDRAAFSQLWDLRKVSVVYRGMKLIKDRETGGLQLYDLGSDPSEANNLAASQPDVARSLEDKLDAWVKDQGPGP